MAVVGSSCTSFSMGKEAVCFPDGNLASVGQGSSEGRGNLKDGHVLKPRQTGKGGITKGMTWALPGFSAKVLHQQGWSSQWCASAVLKWAQLDTAVPAEGARAQHNACGGEGEVLCSHYCAFSDLTTQCRLGCCLAGWGRSRLCLSFVPVLPFPQGPTELPAGESYEVQKPFV